MDKLQMENVVPRKKFTIEEKCQIENEKVGTLEYYDCQECRNKGLVYSVVNNTIAVKPCKCLEIRKMYANLDKCGIPKEMFDKSDLNNFECTNEWQKKFKGRIEKYVSEFLADEEHFSKWLFISGLSGVGKTMLSTYVFKIMILHKKHGKYILWKNMVDLIKPLKRSTFSANQERCEEIMNELKTVDVLYIDDFFKLINSYSMNDELEIAYEIINARYNNNLITIISSELSQKEIATLDIAICGRINEKCNGYWIKIMTEKTKENLKRNYRLKDMEEI